MSIAYTNPTQADLVAKEGVKVIVSRSRKEINNTRRTEKWVSKPCPPARPDAHTMFRPFENLL
jgi:hypothetical protein